VAERALAQLDCLSEDNKYEHGQPSEDDFDFDIAYKDHILKK